MHINERQREGMTHGYQLRRALGGGDAGKSGDLQGIALRILRQRAKYRLRHSHEGRSFSFARGRLLAGDVHHRGAPLAIVMREFRHFQERGITHIISPAANSSRSGGTTSRQSAFANAATSPDPCHLTGSTSGTFHSPASRAGRNRVRPLLTRKGATNRAPGACSGKAQAPATARTILFANSSNVTIVEIGLPGRPKK